MTVTRFTFNGVDVPVDSVTYGRRCRDDDDSVDAFAYAYGCDLFSLERREPATYTVEATIPMRGGWDDFAKLVHPQPFGASPATLARRVKYGGRKGRSAIRRLFARALPVEMATEYLRFRGRAVMLDESEMRIRLYGVKAR